MSERGHFGQRTVLALTLGTALIAAMFMLVVQRWYAEREELGMNIVAQASIIGANASAAVVFGDRAAATEMLASASASPTVIESVLYRANGRALARYRARGAEGAPLLGEEAPPPGKTFGWRELLVVLPVRHNDKEIGRVAIVASQRTVYAELGEFLAAFVVVAMLATVFGYLATARLRRRVDSTQTQLEHSRRMLQQMIAHREHLLEEEHKRIAMEIHDQLGQILTAALLNLRMLERSARTLSADETAQIRAIETQLNEAYCGMKDIAAVLHPAVLQFGLAAAVEWLAERTLAPAGIAWRFERGGGKPEFEPQRLLALFRIVQESLTNIARHARAKNVEIAFRQTSAEFRLEIRDDGVGFVPTEVDDRRHFGIAGMRERAQGLRGRLEVSGAPGEGTRIVVHVPIVGLDNPFVGWDNSIP